jgi:hypothetical protein
MTIQLQAAGRLALPAGLASPAGAAVGTVTSAGSTWISYIAYRALSARLNNSDASGAGFIYYDYSCIQGSERRLQQLTALS